MAGPTVTVNVCDDTASGHVSITVTDSSGVLHSYERQLNTNMTLGLVTEVGVVGAAVATMSSLGPPASLGRGSPDSRPTSNAFGEDI